MTDNELEDMLRRALIDKLIEENRIRISPFAEDEAPDAIIGAPWPAPIPGCRQYRCADCQDFLSLSPDGQQMSARFPNVAVLCIVCCVRRQEKLPEC